MRILILNWRDILNPAGGGAEILTHQLAQGWVKAGNEVTWFTANFKNGKEFEVFDGIRIIRKGSWWYVHILAFFYYLQNHKDIDIIIDEVHWFPFFAGIYARKKTIALTCEVANKLFYTLFPASIAIAFRGIEKFYLYVYRDIPTLTISDSTKKDLIKEGVQKNLITVLRLGINIPSNLHKQNKEKNPTFIYLARLNKQKGIYDAINAFTIINKQLNKSVLWIVGSGEEEILKSLKEMVREAGLSTVVKFFGFVTEIKKYELLEKAHILIVPSVQEGWGLTVIEAASQGTPSVGYDVEGLKDSIVDKKSGMLTNPDPQSLATGALQLFDNKVQYIRLGKEAKVWAQKFDWNEAQEKSLDVLYKLKL